MQEPRYQIRPSHAKRPTRDPAQPCERNRPLFRLLAKHSEQQRGARVRLSRRQKVLRRLLAAEEEAEKRGGITGPIRPEQRQISAEIDRLRVELEALEAEQI